MIKNELNSDSLALWGGGTWENGRPVGITGVSVDSRTVTPGVLFVALRGENRDGHEFVESALRRGAAGAVVDGEYSRTVSVPLLRVSDPLRALQDMAAGYRQSRKLRVVGITGSAGKTTVKEMTADVLSGLAPVSRTYGNWNNSIGLPLSLLNMDHAARFGVFEVGINHPGEMAPLCRILAPDWGIVTNVGPVHIEFFNSEEHIAREKAGLLRTLPPTGGAVLCVDAPWYDVLCAAAPEKVVGVALTDVAGADYYLAVGESNDPGETVTIMDRVTGEGWPVRPPLPGRHILRDMLLAAAMGRAWGVPWPLIVAALENYKSQSMRWERCEWRDTVVINDAYNANPMSMLEALSAFAQISGKRKWLVLGDMLELGENAAEFHRQTGCYAARGTWQGLVTVGSLASLIADEAQKCGLPAECIYRCAAPEDAAAILAGVLVAGDLVLLKGSRGIHLEHILGL